MERITDKKLAEALKSNAEGLLSKGVEPSAIDIKYIQLAEAENRIEGLHKIIYDLTGENIRLREAVQRYSENNREYD